MTFGAKLHDARTPAQKRTAQYVGPVIAASLVSWFLFDALLTRVVGQDLGTMISGALAVSPAVAVHHYAIGGRSVRRATVEGIATGALVAFLYWAIWVAGRPPAW